MRLPKFVWNLIGKKIINEATDGHPEKFEVSKAKMAAVVYVLVTAVQTLGPAFGYNIEIPPAVFRVLEALGLWAVRDAIKS